MGLLPEIAPIVAALASVRRRLRLQAAARGAATSAVQIAVFALIGVYLHLLGLIGPRGWEILGGLCAGALAIGALAGALGRLPLPRVAKRIDASHALADRLGSALEFAAAPARTPFMEAAIADAALAAGRVTPAVAAPWARPPHLGVAGLIGALAAFLLLFHFPAVPVPVPVRVPEAPRLAIDRDLLEPEREMMRDLLKAANESDDPDLKELAEELKKLFDQLDKRELTRKELFEKLAELEKKAMLGDHGNFEELKQKLKKAGDELSKDSLAKDAGKALQQAELLKAKQELEKLAQKIEQMKLDDKQREKLARALDNAAKEQPTPQEQKAAQEQRKLEQEQRRLQREQEKDPKNQETQRRLERNQRQLQQMQRDQQQQKQQQRQLQRMQREMQAASQQMQQGQNGQSSQSMRNAAEQLGKMEQEYRKLGNGQQAQQAIAQLREMMRRMSQQGQGPQNAGMPRQGQGQGQQGQSVTLQEVNVGQPQPGQGKDGLGKDGQGKDGQGKDGQGKDGQGKQGQNMKDFLARAKGQGDKGDSKLFMPGEGGENGEQLMLPMGEGQKPGPSGTGHDMPGMSPGDGIGDSHDPHMRGDATRLAARRKELQAEGKQGAGPSRSETILGSAEKGFATANYRRVYGDYTSVVEEVMSKEQVPPGYRFYVKRYFQLIKPRE